MSPLHIGLIGADIGGSLSPSLHNAEAEALGIPYRYDLLDITALGASVDETPRVLRDAVAQGYNGFNVTHPCKLAVIPALDALDPDAAALGAVNTVTLTERGLVGHNTDHSGFLTGLRHRLPQASTDGVAVVGAGGAGSAVAYSLAQSGTRRLILADVDPYRAEALAERLSGVAPSVTVTTVVPDELGAVAPALDGIVNATPIGMDGIPGLPFDPAFLDAHHWVADVIYRPIRTALLEEAERRGCAVMDGGAMLVAQAADTMTRLAGVHPDLGRMRVHLDGLLRRPVTTA